MTQRSSPGVSATLDPFMTRLSGVGERRWWWWRAASASDNGEVAVEVEVPRRSANHGAEKWRRQRPASRLKVCYISLMAFITLYLFLTLWMYKAKRADGDVTVTSSNLPFSDLTSGAWSSDASPPSCAANGAISSITTGSKITYQFYGW